MKITSIEMRTAPMAHSWLTEKRIANPMSPYEEYAERRSSWYRTNYAGVVIVTVEDGTEGYGFVGGGKARAASVILDDHLRDLVVGKDCFATELISQQLFRATIYYGQGGLAQDLISGIDIALWDIKGKLLGAPVYDLLGGRTREELRPYLTSWSAAAMDEFGIRDVKVAVPYGPAGGEAGMRENERLVAEARELVGPDGFISLDCYMAWDIPYTVEMYRRLRDYRIEWIEEPVMPDDIDGYRRIRESVDCMVSGGEHTFTLSGFRRLIEEGAIDIVQPDIYRAGGPTVLSKVAAIAEANNVRLMCHGVGLASYHFMISRDPHLSPRCEYLDIYDGDAEGWVMEGEPKPRDGSLHLPAQPGFGYRLNRAAFDRGEAVAGIW